MTHTMKESSFAKLKTCPSGYYIHPQELAFCGFSGAGKTTLITRLIGYFSLLNISCGYIKHDAHSFAMDHQGKDTHSAYAAGAHSVFIHDGEHEALVRRNEQAPENQGAAEFSNSGCDLLFLEGRKHSPLPKLVLLDPRGEIDPLLKNSELESVEALVYSEGDLDRAMSLARGSGIEVLFSRDDIEAIARWIQARAEKARPRIRVLILGGGRSSRMGTDKAGIDYHGKSQLAYLASLSAGISDSCFASLRPQQALPADCQSMARIDDRFDSMGPLGGILSAFEYDPRCAWLVLSCDLPLITTEDLEQLVGSRDWLKLATAFCDHQHRVEPLVAIYEPKARARMYHGLAMGIRCPRALFSVSAVKLIEPQNPQAIFNANTEHERLAAIALVRGVNR